MLIIVGALLARFALLTVEHGVVGLTGFGTSTGTTALLITEDTILGAVALIPLWSLLVDGLLRPWQWLTVLALVAGVIAVDLFSVRRTGLVFFAVAAVLLTLRLWRRLFPALAGLTLVVGVVAVESPNAPLVSHVRYTIESSLLLTSDPSTRIRISELHNYVRNVVSEEDLLLGRGIGAPGTCLSPARLIRPRTVLVRTEYVRLGWHVFGLDWLYKLGIIGVLGTATLAFVAGARVASSLGSTNDRMVASLTRALLVSAPAARLGLSKRSHGRLRWHRPWASVETRRERTRTIREVPPVMAASRPGSGSALLWVQREHDTAGLRSNERLQTRSANDRCIRTRSCDLYRLDPRCRAAGAFVSWLRPLWHFRYFDFRTGADCLHRFRDLQRPRQRDLQNQVRAMMLNGQRSSYRARSSC